MGFFDLDFFDKHFKGRLSQKYAKEPKNAPGDRRIIKTARTVEAINDAARKGFRPLIKPVKANPKITAMVAVFQDPKTGEIEVVGDTRGQPDGDCVIDYTIYYPYAFPEPFAAYLIPKDLAVNEEVWIEDIIEDIVAIWGNQNQVPRLQAAPALWNGKDFFILFDPDKDAPVYLG
jgi:hypothetical protein